MLKRSNVCGAKGRQIGRTQKGNNVCTQQDRENRVNEGEMSVGNTEIRFNNLGHIIDADMLKELYHKLSAKKAKGIDGMTKQAYGEKLDENICNLIKKIRRGTYKPKPARITEIPKEDGSKRPLAISCFEDKLVQLAVSDILSKIYEPLFVPNSFGFRAGKSCHDALKALNQATFKNWNGAIVEIDIRKYFNTIPHQEIMLLLSKKIVDKRFVRLIEVLSKIKRTKRISHGKPGHGRHDGNLTKSSECDQRLGKLP